ncbi:hypothetical protein MG293_017512 [Ovis ammon polii]|uniref:Uncharacterized protein n=1 Tax=Ovis ammon polii TaxID=230172 RepID=A0AAD4TQ72_OVIAM|nr:hypothetical protein MG293_017512 [Ovis ammon polii]
MLENLWKKQSRRYLKIENERIGMSLWFWKKTHTGLETVRFDMNSLMEEIQLHCDSNQIIWNAPKKAELDERRRGRDGEHMVGRHTPYYTFGVGYALDASDALYIILPLSNTYSASRTPGKA